MDGAVEMMECGFVLLLFSRPFYCFVKAIKVASIDWIRKSKSNVTKLCCSSFKGNLLHFHG